MDRKVAVAMSGGVDSSVAAALAVEKYGADNVFGVTMKLYCYGGQEAGGRSLEADKSCCSLDSINDAVAVCLQLGIRHYVINLEKEFDEAVIQNFISEYQNARTPNPCILCNSVIKFDYLLRKVQELGADILVTGHYARIACEDKKQNTKDNNITVLSSRVKPDKDSATEGSRSLDAARDDNCYLLRGVDKSKDQSYFLYGIKKEDLENIWFPVGEMKKTETRAKAAELGLKTATKSESQDICFIETNVADFLSSKIEMKPGDIVDIEGSKMGEHEGLPLYTIGQRKGLGGGFADSMYVVGFNIKKNELIIGTKEALAGDRLLVDEINWLVDEPKLPKSCQAKIRYNSELAECIVESHPELDKVSYSIQFSKPQTAITPGQSIVLYDGELVLGGGVISASL